MIKTRTPRPQAPTGTTSGASPTPRRAPGWLGSRLPSRPDLGEPPRGEMRLPPSLHDQHGDGRMAYRALRDAAQEKPRDTAHAARAEDQHVGPRGPDRLEQFGQWDTGAKHRTDSPSGPNETPRRRLDVAPGREHRPRVQFHDRLGHPRAHRSGRQSHRWDARQLADSNDAYLSAWGSGHRGEEADRPPRVPGAVEPEHESPHRPGPSPNRVASRSVTQRA